MDTYLSPGKVAAKLGVSRQQIDKWLRAGRIKHTLIGGTRYVRLRDVKKPRPAKPGRKSLRGNGIRRAKKPRKTSPKSGRIG
jgi:excisionase family DNA binding protein